MMGADWRLCGTGHFAMDFQCVARPNPRPLARSGLQAPGHFGDALAQLQRSIALQEILPVMQQQQAHLVGMLANPCGVCSAACNPSLALRAAPMSVWKSSTASSQS